VISFVPGKGIGAHEYIEDKYHHAINKTNYKELVNQSKLQNINFLDLVAYYHQIKDTTKYPLYARFAHHWTNYFDCLASKKIIKYVEELRKTDLPDFIWNKAEVSDTARSRDADVLKSMNLYTTPKYTQKLLYPIPLFEMDSTKIKLKCLLLETAIGTELFI